MVAKVVVEVCADVVEPIVVEVVVLASGVVDVYALSAVCSKKHFILTSKHSWLYYGRKQI